MCREGQRRETCEEREVEEREERKVEEREKSRRAQRARRRRAGMWISSCSNSGLNGGSNASVRKASLVVKQKKWAEGVAFGVWRGERVGLMNSVRLLAWGSYEFSRCAVLCAGKGGFSPGEAGTPFVECRRYHGMLISVELYRRRRKSRAVFGELSTKRFEGAS